MPLVSITTAEPSLEHQCRQISKEFSIPYVDEIEPTEYSLKLDKAHLSLIKNSDAQLKPFYIDFCEGKLAYRSIRANMELLGKAIGLKKLKNPKVLDATAGFGRDGFLLASLGCDVTMLERSPILYLLLNDALERYETSIQSRLNLKLLHQDSIAFLKTSETYPIIYLDPMFPERRKSALVKKEMRFLHDIVGLSEQDYELLKLSLQKSEKRVVVKRPLHAEYLAQKKPDFSYKGKAIRFDIYSKATR